MRPFRITALVVAALATTLAAGCFDDDTFSPEPTPVPQDAPLDYEAASAEANALITSLEHRLSTLESSAGARAVVTLPAGSVDALEGAIASAGPGGTVIVRPGLHTESETVTIPHRVAIVGQPGAILRVDTMPTTATGGIVDPALHVWSAPGTWISGLEITGNLAPSGTGVLVQNSPNTTVARNAILGHEVGVALEQADGAVVWANRIADGSVSGYGVVVINAERASILSNDVSGSFFGLWPCDRRGTIFFNDCHENFIGIILCKVPDSSLILPGGAVVGAEFSAEQWVVGANDAHHNFDAGYLVIDGANHNLVAANAASSNGTYDFELTGDSMRFGFLTPASFDNVAVVIDPNDTVKDCGNGNTVVGGTRIDLDQDPCY